MVKTEVTCYAGSSYPERPRSFLCRGERLAVAEVARRERLPRELRFLVRVPDGRRFWLTFDQSRDVWDVRPGGVSAE